MHTPRDSSSNPLRQLEDWDDDVARRYPMPETQTGVWNSERRPAEFRDYTEQARDGVKEFYRLNHQLQTVEFNREARDRFLPARRRQMSIWEAMEYLNQLVDDSDPDTELPQIAHAIQTAEAMRANGEPDWFVLTGLIHDMGKVLCLFDEPQWAVTGDTFPVGCRYSPKIVYYEFFEQNPDWSNPAYQSECGIYEAGCGLDQVMMSWGHDEYLYQVVKEYLPPEAQYMIRYHSFYAAHREGEYQYLMDDRDRELFQWVKRFNPYDLYTKSDVKPDWDAVLPYYRRLVAKYFPDSLWW